MFNLGKTEKLGNLSRENGFKFIKKSIDSKFLKKSINNECEYLYTYNSNNLPVCYIYLSPIWKNNSSILLTNLDNKNFEKEHLRLREIYGKLKEKD